MALLDAAHLSLRDVDLFAVATGPGSFTGLRIGIATMQGLAFAQGKPLLGVSAFDALAAAVDHPWLRGDPPARVATWVDAWRGEVYAALYEAGRPIEEPSVQTPARLLERLAGSRVIVVGDGAATYADRIHAALGPDGVVAEPALPALAGIVARLAAASARAGVRTRPHDIRPLYVRRSDAELTRDAQRPS